MHRTVTLVVLASLLPLSLAAVSPPPPAEVAAATAAGLVTVSWAPAPGLAAEDVTYRVYGLDEGGATLLGSAPGETPVFRTRDLHASYGVATVLDGVESPLARACIIIETDRTPPLVKYDPRCPGWEALSLLGDDGRRWRIA